VFAIFSLEKCVSLGKRVLAILVGGSVLGTCVCHYSLGKGLFASLVWETCLCHLSLGKGACASSVRGKRACHVRSGKLHRKGASAILGWERGVGHLSLGRRGSDFRSGRDERTTRSQQTIWETERKAIEQGTLKQRTGSSASRRRSARRRG
jgi:hypothetical protein